MSGSADDVIMHADFMAFVMDEGTQEILRGWVERQGWPAATVQIGGVELFGTMLERSAPPRLAIIDLDGQVNLAETCSRLVSLCGHDVKLIAIGTANDIGLYRQMISSGIADYLVKPLSNEMLDQALRQSQEKAQSNNSSGQVERSSKFIYIIGTRGGIGATTLAVNLSWMMANEEKVQTALLDLDLQFGNGALALDIEPSRGLRDILSSPSRVDSLMVASAMMAAGSKLSVLSAEESVEESAPLDAAALQAVLQEMRENFDYVFVDVPRHMISTQRRLIAEASAVIVITEQSLVGIRDTLRIKMALKSIDPTLPVLVVTARHAKDRPAHIDAATFEKNSQGKIDFTVPEENKIALEAANAGKTVAAMLPQSASSKAYRAILHHLVGKQAATEKKKSGGWFGAKDDKVKDKKT
ncbi:MAG: AAA family ATPase [Alphaproteobacteria bacterium]|nr:AAA family ATPase [Alphaproteobacteria bacterium]